MGGALILRKGNSDGGSGSGSGSGSGEVWGVPWVMV